MVTEAVNSLLQDNDYKINIGVTNSIHNITKGQVGSYISFQGDDTTEATPFGFSILLKFSGIKKIHLRNVHNNSNAVPQHAKLLNYTLSFSFHGCFKTKKSLIRY